MQESEYENKEYIDISSIKYGSGYRIPSSFFFNEVTTSNTIIGYGTVNPIISIEVPANLGGGICGVKKMGAFSYFGNGFDARFVEEIGRFCIIANNVTLGAHTHNVNALSAHPMFVWPKSRFENFHQPFDENICALNRKCALENGKKLPGIKNKVLIGNDVWIGNNVLILPGVKVGNGAVIGAGAVVTHDVEPYSIIGGNPARTIRKRFSEKQIASLERIKWWEYGPDILNGIQLDDIDSAIEILCQRIKDGFPKYEPICYEIDCVNNIMVRNAVKKQ